jgi:hypothetical protein
VNSLLFPASTGYVLTTRTVAGPVFLSPFSFLVHGSIENSINSIQMKKNQINTVSGKNFPNFKKVYAIHAAMLSRIPFHALLIKPPQKPPD